VISASGEATVTVRAVAAQAGTSPSAVYTLFGSREALIAAVSEEGFRRFGTHLAAAAPTEDPVADLSALGTAYRASALADPHFYRVMFDRGVTAEPVPVVQRPTFLVLRAAVARVLALADPTAPAARAEEAALGLWALAHGLVSLELAGLVPGDAGERAARYDAILRAGGPAILAR
jgi:AcrR family transcriptional regulator